MEKVFLVKVEDIPEGRKQLEIEGDQPSIESLFSDDTETGLIASPLTLTGCFDRCGAEIVFKASCRVQLKLNCTRCLNDFLYRLDSEFRYICKSGPEKEGLAERELQQDEVEILFYEGDRIDLGAIVREQIYLNLPQYPHCSDTCLGLCPNCGANLNTGGCTCPQAAGRETSPFSALKSLKDKQ